MTAYHEVEVIEGDGGEEIDEQDPRFNPFRDAIDDENDDGGGSRDDEVSDDPDSGDEEESGDSIELIDVKVDGGNDGLGFETINRTHESNAEIADKLKESGGEPKPESGPNPPDPSLDPAPDDPNDLAGTWYLLNSYYVAWEGITDHITPAMTTKAAVVRFERRDNIYVGRVVRDGVLPGTNHGMKTDPLRKGQEVCWVQREGDKDYTGRILVTHGRQPYQWRKPARFVVQGDRALIWGGNVEGVVFHSYTKFGQTGGESRGFRISSKDHIGRHEPDRQGDSIGLVGVDVD